MNDFTVKDLENLSGIKAHTIGLIWEQRYNFQPKSVLIPIFVYSNEELKTLLNIALLNKYGFKLCHIDQMCNQEICSRCFHLMRRAVDERVVNDLVRHMVDLETGKFEKIIHGYIQENGIELSLSGK